MKTCVMMYVLILSFIIVSSTQAQFYVGADFGFRSYGLKGSSTISAGGNSAVFSNNTDAGKTVLNMGLIAGYQVMPASVLHGWYKLDLGLHVSYSSIAFLEAAWNNARGAGNWSANGFQGGTTRALGIDIMPIHRLNIPGFRLLSPYAGLGFSLNMFSTSDITSSKYTGTWAGNSEMKMGLLIFYGTVIRAADHVEPFIQFTHYVPFGSSTQFTNDTNVGNLVVMDVPGFFGLSGGVRFTF